MLYKIQSENAVFSLNEALSRLFFDFLSQIMKKNDQMYTLLAICLTLCPQVRKALGLISVSLVDHESQACAEYYKIHTAWTGLPYHKTDSRAFCLCCSELMRTFIHNFVKSVEKDCKGCSVGTYHIRFVFIKSLLSFEQTERDNVVQLLVKIQLYL